MINKIKTFIKSDRFKDELSAWKLFLATGAVMGLLMFFLGAPWWVILPVVLFGGLIFWTLILIGIFLILALKEYRRN